MPGDKSISHRYVMLGAIAQGTTRITNLAPGADVAATMACFRELGVQIEAAGPDLIVIKGGAGRDFEPQRACWTPQIRAPRCV